MKKMNLDTMNNMSIDQIIQLYNQGYRIEDSKIINLQYIPPSLLFHANCPNLCPDAHIIINNTDRGITDSSGTLLITGFSPGSTIDFIVTKLGFKDSTGNATVGGFGSITDVPINLVPETDTASLKFIVTEPGPSTQLPSYGSRIILDNIEFGTTDKFGVLLVTVAANTTIPFLVNKAGFPEFFGIARVGAKDTTTVINVDLDLFPTRTITILRTALIGTIFLTSVGFIGGYIIKTIGNKKEKLGAD